MVVGVSATAPVQLRLLRTCFQGIFPTAHAHKQNIMPRQLGSMCEHLAHQTIHCEKLGQLSSYQTGYIGLDLA